MENSKRNSLFEWIKVVAIVCIIFCHSVPTERIEYHYATNDPWLFGVMMFRQLGSVGNAIFIVASSWFLVESDTVNLRKMQQIITDNQVISILFVLCFLRGGYCLPSKVVLKQIFPFLFSTLWYITCYGIYYCLHGFVNKALRESRIDARFGIVVMLILDSIVFVTRGLYFNELIGFLMIHVFTWYLKETLQEIDHKKRCQYGMFLFGGGLTGWIVGAIVLDFIGIRIAIIGEKFHMWNIFMNPFVLAAVYGTMILASCGRNRYSGIVNALSGYSLYIYMITGNQLLRMYFDNTLYDIVIAQFGVSTQICFIFVTGYAVIKIVLGVWLSIIYKYSIGKLVSIVVARECDVIGRWIKGLIVATRSHNP